MRRRWLALATLAVLFLAGPMHVWHHFEAADGPVGEGHCLPCSTFCKAHFVIATAANLLGDSVCFGTVAVAPCSRELSTPAFVVASRAPPSVA